MATISEALAIAVQHHQAGRLQAAEQIYRQVLAVAPNHADAHNDLGIVLKDIGLLDEAVACYRHALALKPDFAEAHNNLGAAFQGQGKLEEAATSYRNALTLKPDIAEINSNLGSVFQGQGKLAEAAACYRRAVQLKPQFAEAHNNLGTIFKDQGKLEEAAACYRHALALKPEYAEAHNNLGNVLKDLGKLDEAVAYYVRALALKPDYVEARNNLGSVFQDQAKLDEAVACYRQALALQPNFARAHNNLGAAFQGQGKLDEAVACYRRALELEPDHAPAHNNLGNVFRDQGKLDEAVACYRRALGLKPDFAEAHRNLGAAFHDQGKLDEAVACYRLALDLKPDFAEAHRNLGAAFKDLGKLDEAVACYRLALELKPDFAEAHSSLGTVFKEDGKLDEAVACYRRALELKPDFAEAHNNLGNAFKEQGKVDEAVACYRRALALKPDFAKAHSNMLLVLQYSQAITPTELAQAHAEFDRQHAAQLRGASADDGGARDRHGRPRLGFVSPDFGRHPVGYFLVRVLENLGLQQNETICYSDRIVKDDVTHRFQAAAHQWRDVIGMSDEQLAEQIRADRIDILFDLSGHTAGNRLLVFARKPAPIQVTYAGYVGTTGLQAMDYLLADRHSVPPGAERHYQEQVLRMPDGYLCYDPPAFAPTVNTLPALEHGRVTFGCFNNPAKLTLRTVEVWAKILHRLPQARLVLKYRGAWNESGVARRYAQMFVDSGIDPNRVEFLGNSSHAESLAGYNRIDLALDPFPYSGSVTTCEALWMGVPVITCPLETFASRQSLSHLCSLGLTDTIAGNLDEYVELAVALAEDLPRVATMRAGLRQRMAVSPLCDGQRFAKNLMALLCDCVSRLA